jgi:hypothetical protein
VITRLGLNYLWGLANFAVGSIAGGISVAVMLISYGVLNGLVQASIRYFSS